MIELTGTAEEIKMRLNQTTIGTCTYTAQRFPMTGEILHSVLAVNGTKLQWITTEVSLLYAEEEAIREITRRFPPLDTAVGNIPERLPPTPVAW